MGVAIACAIAFGITYGLCGGDPYATSKYTEGQCDRITSSAAALEWAVAFILVIYFFTLAADLWPAGKSSPRYMRRLARWQEGHVEGDDFTGRKAFGRYPDRWQTRAQMMQGDMIRRNEGVSPQAQPGMGGYGDTPRDSLGSQAPMMRQV